MPFAGFDGEDPAGPDEEPALLLPLENDRLRAIAPVATRDETDGEAKERASTETRELGGDAEERLLRYV